MNKREAKRLREKRKRLKNILIAEIIVAVLAVGIAAVFAFLPEKTRGGSSAGNPSAAENITANEAVTDASSSETASQTENSEEASAETKSEAPSSTTEGESTETASAAETETSSETEASDSTAESDTAEETSSEGSEEETGSDESTEESAKETVDYRNVVFIGDSRTLSMGVGGELAYDLVPMDSISATWGAQLTDEAAYANVSDAAGRERQIAVFWYGINDVQLNPNRDSAEEFIMNYQTLISAYRTMNDSSKIYLLSILPTTPEEKDYYEGQDENIAAYNAALQQFAAENGYQYLELSPLFTGNDCFAEGDNIHFSKAWYEERFLPAVTRALGIVY